MLDLRGLVEKEIKVYFFFKKKVENCILFIASKDSLIDEYYTEAKMYFQYTPLEIFYDHF